MFIGSWGHDLPCRHREFTGVGQSLCMPDDSGPGARHGGLHGALHGGGTPQQIHLTWGDDPARSVVVSWASQAQAVRPRVRIGQRVIGAEERVRTDGLSGRAVWTYHARVHGLRPGATYGYAVTADNDADGADPFSATFTTAPEGRAAFRFTSFGDLAAQGADRVLSHGQSAYAVGAVESFQPLFHLLNGDLGDTGRGPAAQPRAGRDLGDGNQASAAYRPWMPVPGSHDIEFGNGPQGLASYLTRYTLPSNGTPGLQGRWYRFRIGSALFVSLSADDVACQDAGAFAAGPGPLIPRAGGPPVPAGTSFYVHGYSGGAQTRWLEATLAAARRDASIDWIIAATHQCACSSSRDGDGSDLGIRRQWLPLFDRYEVDLVLCGHDYGYERSFPVRGFDTGAGASLATGAQVDTMRPRPVTTVDSGVFDTSQGTVHLVLGCGGAASAGADGAHGADWAHGADGARGDGRARVFTRANRPVPSSAPGVYVRGGADAAEDAIWSARRDTSAGYGIAVFDVDPGTEAGGQASITVTRYRAAGAGPAGPAGRAGPEAGALAGDHTPFETVTLVRPRSDGRRWHAKQSTAAAAT